MTPMFVPGSNQCCFSFWFRMLEFAPLMSSTVTLERSVFDCARSWYGDQWRKRRWGRVPLPLIDSSIPIIGRRSRVYFIQEHGTGAIKIGVATQLKQRMHNLSVASPHELTLLATTVGGREVEQRLHQRFAHARLRGEWFRPVQELLEYIEDLKRLRRLS